MAIRRGNPNWGNPEFFTAMPQLLTVFEQTVRDFNLQPEQYRQSEALREWAQRNCGSKYVPEPLLKAWGLSNKA